jgi:hypothetical protein
MSQSGRIRTHEQTLEFSLIAAVCMEARLGCPRLLRGETVRETCGCKLNAQRNIAVAGRRAKRTMNCNLMCDEGWMTVRRLNGSLK